MGIAITKFTYSNHTQTLSHYELAESATHL